MVLVFAVVLLAVTPVFAADPIPPKNGEKYVVGMAIVGLQHPFFTNMKGYLEAEAERQDVDLIVLDALADVGKQMSQIEDLIQQDVDLLLVVPVKAEALTPSIEAANEAGIPVVVVDRRLVGGEYLNFSSTDNVAIGRAAGNYVATRLDGAGKVVEIEGQPGADADFDIWVLSNSSGWIATGDSITCVANTDDTLIGSITSNCADYIIGGVLTWGVYQADDTNLIRIDFLETVVDHMIPYPVFCMEYDYGTTQSNVRPTIGEGASLVPYDIDVSMASASGWVFVSFPITATGDVLTVFDDAGWSGGITDWDIIQWYDPSDNEDRWKTYNKAQFAAGITQDMPNIDNTMGVWVHLTANDDLLRVGEGQDPSGTTVNLVAGWNMVGFPSQIEGHTAGDLKIDSGGLVTSIERFNDAAAYDMEIMPDGDMFLIGQAYWVYSTGVYAWVIP